MIVTQFCTFRDQLYHTVFPKRADALFEIMDALLTQAPAFALAELSLIPFFHRGWKSVYDALACGKIDSSLLRAFWWTTPQPSAMATYAIDGTDYPRPWLLSGPSSTQPLIQLMNDQ